MREYVQGPGGGRLLHTGTQTCTNVKYNNQRRFSSFFPELRNRNIVKIKEGLAVCVCV